MLIAVLSARLADHERPMPARFLAYLATAGAETLGAATLCAQARAMWPGAPGMGLRPLLTITAPEEMGGGPGFLLEAAGQRYSVLFVARPLTPDAYASAVEIARDWPGARIAMASHSAHVIIATASTLPTHPEALQAASAMSLVIAALTTLLPAIAIIWTNGDAISPPESFRAATLALQRAQIPVGEWVGVRWHHAEATLLGGPRAGALTTGLEPFIGREIELVPSALPPALLMARFSGLCHALILSGEAAAEAAMAWVPRAERIRLRPRREGLRLGLPVLELTVEAPDAAPVFEPPRGFGRKLPD